MPFLRLIFNLEAIRKLAERGLSADDVADVFRATPVVTVPNPNPRADHTLLAIGPDRLETAASSPSSSSRTTTTTAGGTYEQLGSPPPPRSRSTARPAEASS
jgi:hypothetical protein